MVNKLRQADPTLMNRSRVRQGLARLRRRFMSLRRSDIAYLREKIQDLFKTVFTNLAQRRFHYRERLKTEVPTVETWNESLEDIQEDVSTLYEERVRVGELAKLTFNYNQVLVQELTERAARTASRVIDLRILSGQLQQHAIVGGDDFNDETRIDGGFAKENPAAEIVPGQGIVTLKRVESIQAIKDTDEVTINPITPGVNRQELATDTRPNINRFYEGHFYDYIGRARPEGNVWNLEEVLQTTSAEGDSNTIIAPYFDFTVFKDQRPIGPGVGKEEALAVGQVLRPQDIRVIDRGATKEELRISRARMVDGNPDTFWECEYVVSRMVDLSDVPINSRDSVLKTLERNNNDFITLEEADVLDLDIEIIIRFTLGPQPVNFLTLNPYDFDYPAWVEVTDVATAPAEDAVFETIPGFNQGLFHNTLTDEANEELEEGTFKATLAPTRYSYRGQGVWTFPKRDVAKIKFKLRQKTPIQSPYQRLALQIRRVLTKTVGSWSEIRESTRVVKLTYLQTVQALDDRQLLEELAGSTEGGSASGSSTNTQRRPVWQRILDPLSLFSSDKTTTVSSSHTDTGWSVMKEWLETKDTVARYAIGIRDIGAFSYRYAPSSELVSVLFTSPKEIIKAQLRVDQIIPEELAPDQQWIKYYISSDEGQTWLQINPLDHPTAFGDNGSITPYTYTFNLEKEGPQAEGTSTIRTPVPVRSLRFKAVFFADSTLRDGDRITPVLKSYRVFMFPKGGLTDAGF